MYVNVDVEVDVDQVLEGLTVEELEQAVASRKQASPDSDPSRLLDNVYWEFRRRGDCPQSLRDYFWIVLGRYL